MNARIRFVPFVCITALLLLTFRLYTGAYFWVDDFTALYWAQTQSALDMFWDVVNPASKFFRPTGILVYWIMLHLFGLNSPSYHYLAWSLHAVNTALVYVILKRLTESRAGASVGAM